MSSDVAKKGHGGATASKLPSSPQTNSFEIFFDFICDFICDKGTPECHNWGGWYKPKKNSVSFASLAALFCTPFS